MRKATGLLIFAAGVAVGSIVTWRYTKKKYERIAQEEIDSVKEVFGRRKVHSTNNTNNGGDKNATKTTNDISNYTNALSDYANEEDDDEYFVVEDEKALKRNAPYVITPDEFGEREDYDTISLMYFADGVLTDDDYELVDDADNVIGLESLNHFGEYEDDSVFVRNPRLKSDFEILYDQRDYYPDVFDKLPPRVEL